MKDPYEVLGLPTDADDETIRRRYLELVRENPPERAPARFAEVRAAYDELKNLETRLRKRLFEVDTHLSIETIIEELACKNPRPRMSLKKMVEMATSR